MYILYADAAFRPQTVNSTFDSAYLKSGDSFMRSSTTQVLSESLLYISPDWVVTLRGYDSQSVTVIACYSMLIT
jgi:hypothetical protein